MGTSFRALATPATACTARSNAALSTAEKGADAATAFQTCGLTNGRVAIDRYIRALVYFGALGLAAPAIAPALLRSMVLAPTGAVPVITPAKPAGQPAQRTDLPAPASVRSGSRQVSLRADEQGQYEAHAVINGLTVPAIVDTGATTVAISAETARRLGVMPPQSAFRLVVSTANGVLAAAPVILREVNVGGIAVQNVDAMVIPGSALSVSLLGMTYLSRLSKFEIAGGQLTLHQ